MVALLAPAGVAEEDAREAVEEMREPDAEMGAARCSAAFGMPWAELTENMLRSQLLLLANGERPFHEQMRQSSPEQLLALRERLDPGLPGDVARVLSWCRTYASSVQ